MPKSQKLIKSRIDPSKINVSSLDAGSISVIKWDPVTGEQWGEKLYADGRVERTERRHIDSSYWKAERMRARIRMRELLQNPPIQPTENT